ncbi:hypothetical protein AMATHDRAFT_71672 [Amanita thiersii Skay4041]|uniref:Uncharacterized protein n=1 Tax=Amanita thiersii Skay4041 TaxID=703135 RepID=A0A2A9NCF9_9AGAR|nr:hypothetical protein AMATHDRAFT_71672 [Amanita thiersii Skay4041]
MYRMNTKPYKLLILAYCCPVQLAFTLLQRDYVMAGAIKFDGPSKGIWAKFYTGTPRSGTGIIA